MRATELSSAMKMALTQVSMKWRHPRLNESHGIVVRNEDGTYTGINEVEASEATQPVAIYNLAGQRLNKMQKGINIINGKKVLVK